jgi:hypothetical protein
MCEKLKMFLNLVAKQMFLRISRSDFFPGQVVGDGWFWRGVTKFWKLLKELGVMLILDLKKEGLLEK